MGIKDDNFHKIHRKAEKLEAQVKSHKFHKNPEKREAVYPTYKRKLALNLEISVLKKSIRGASGMVFRQGVCVCVCVCVCVWCAVLHCSVL